MSTGQIAYLEYNIVLLTVPEFHIITIEIFEETILYSDIEQIYVKEE